MELPLERSHVRAIAPSCERSLSHSSASEPPAASRARCGACSARCRNISAPRKTPDALPRLRPDRPRAPCRSGRPPRRLRIRAICARSSGSASLAASSLPAKWAAISPMRRAPHPVADAADHVALMGEQVFRDIPAPVQFADEIGLGHLHIVEEGLAERRTARDQHDRLGRDAGRRPCRRG